MCPVVEFVAKYRTCSVTIPDVSGHSITSATNSGQMCTGIIAIGRVSIDFDGMYSMLKKASIDVCSRKKKLKTTFKIVSAAAASMITKPH